MVHLIHSKKLTVVVTIKLFWFFDESGKKLETWLTAENLKITIAIPYATSRIFLPKNSITPLNMGIKLYLVAHNAGDIS